MQTALTYFAARRRQLITVCVLSLLLVVSPRMTMTHQYTAVLVAGWKETTDGLARFGLRILLNG